VTGFSAVCGYMSGMKFIIMNGAGNRFAIFDAWDEPEFTLSAEKVEKICTPGSEAMGPNGADQLIIIRRPKVPEADAFMEIWNRHGFEVDACGNATRCVAWLYMREMGVNHMTLQTNAGLLTCEAKGEYEIAVDMGAPKLDWQEIPLKEAMHTHHIDVKLGPIDNPYLHNPGAVNMGNPHCVFFVEDIDAVKPEKIGSMIEFHPLFPEQVNVGFAQVIAKDEIRLRVWERGVGMTLACGTGACAAVVAASRQSRSFRKADVIVDGGTLHIEWRPSDDHVIMTGPVELEFEGEVLDA